MNWLMRKLFGASNSQIAIIIFLVALIVRMLFSMHAYNQNVMQKFSDDVAYFHYGTEILRQGFFVTDIDGLGSYSSAVGPGMGWLISITFLFFGVGWIQLFIVNSIVSSITCSIAFLLFQRYSSRLLAFIVSIYLCFYFILFRFVATAGKEIWLAFLIVFIIYLLESIRYSSRLGFIKTGLISFIYVLLIHIDERFLLFAPLLMIAFLMMNSLEIGKRLKIIFLFGTVCFCLSLPWLLRNYQVYNRIILIGVRTNAYTESLLSYDHIDYLGLDSAKSRFFISDFRIPAILRGEEIYTDLGEPITQSQLEAMRQGFMPSNYSLWQTRLFAFVRFWQPFMPSRGMYFQDGHRYISWSWKHNAIVIGFYSWLLIFMPFGFLYLYMRNSSFASVLLLSLLSYSLLHALMVPFCEDRYRIPFDVVIVFTGILGLYYVTNKLFVWNRFIIVYKT